MSLIQLIADLLSELKAEQRADLQRLRRQDSDDLFFGAGPVLDSREEFLSNCWH